jgi:subtilisin family serine protease
MSWDISFKEIEKDLESNGIGKDARERTKMARQLFDVQKEAFREAIKNAPEIVFVNAAGNDDDDPAFQDCIPTAIDLPNVLVAGAVDQAGDETTFTSSGTAVDVYANGYNVESLIPGGQTMAASGTSMSSPQVANLAAKLLALAPQLKAKDVVDLIIAGADKSKDGRILLINPQRSVQLLESKQK